MGWYAVRISVTGVRSAHNSVTDYTDQAKWNYLADRIRVLIAAYPEFESLRLEIEGPDE